MQKINEKIKQKLSLLPEHPGVYRMYDEHKSVIYVGKALNLKNRIKSYFSGTPVDAKTMHLLNAIEDLDYIITNSEQEAFLLEANLIKQYQPKYNILLKDDKKYPYLKVNINEAFPRLEITRNTIKDGSKYYGPYTDVRYLRKLLKELEWIFPHRTCSRVILADTDKPQYDRACLNYQLKKCPAPCIAKISQKDYKKIIDDMIRYILGKNDDLLKDMRTEMLNFSNNLEFEKAAKIRDKIIYIEALQKKQVVYFADFLDRDIIAYYREGKYIAITIIKMTDGKISNKEVYSIKNSEDESIAEILRVFLLQYYADRLQSQNTTENLLPLPYQILIQNEPADFEKLKVLFKNRIYVVSGNKDSYHRKLTSSQDSKKLLEIARKNAFDYVENIKLSHLRKANKTILPVQELKEYLLLNTLPRKMICIDISTIQGSETVSSLVFFENGKPLKRQYKHFIIKDFEGQDDFASVAETLRRFLKNLANDETWERPDLIIVDGGKGQLSSACNVLYRTEFKDIPIISLAKRIEEIFIPVPDDLSLLLDNEKIDLSYNSIVLPKTSMALKLITAIRDEAHRFAITFHRKRRDTRILSSKLDNVKGLGQDKKFLLLKEFGSIKNIASLNTEQLTSIKGIGQKLAEKIIETLNEQDTLPL